MKNVMTKYIEKEEKWAKGYYSQLIGYTITQVKVEAEMFGGMGEVWTRLVAEKKLPDGTTDRLYLELSQDPEGNGPGFLFGLPNFVVE